MGFSFVKLAEVGSGRRSVGLGKGSQALQPGW
jgi:hypothetical protein